MTARALLPPLLLLALAACDPMAEQAKVEPYDLPQPGIPIPGALPPPEGAVTAAAAAPAALPAPGPALLARGAERYGIYCTPCHGPKGKSDGMVAGRLVPDPPPLQLPRLEAASDAQLYGVITNGHGRMYGYASRIPQDDRWAIVAWVRALQERVP